MSFFYDLNKRLAGIGQDKQQVSESKKQEAKTPARRSLEESLAGDLKSLMEGTKPDFLDMDKDGNKKEPMKKAVGDKKKNPFAKKEVDEGVAGPQKCWPGHRKVGTQPGTGKNAGKRVNDCEKIKEDGTGGAAQSNTLEDMDESAFQAYLGKEKYGKAGMKALQQAGREGAGKEKMAKIRAQHDKLDELSPDTLKSYTKKAAMSAVNKGAELGKKQADADEVDRYTNRHFPKGTDQFGQREQMRKAAGADYDDINKTRSKAAKRVAGIGRAVDRMANEGDMDEGNEFSGELVKAKAMGKKDFEVDGKRYPVREGGLPDIADKRAKMAQARGDKPSPLKNVAKGLKAFFKGEPEPMDEADSDMIGYLKKKAGAKNYNAGSGRPDAHNGMAFEGDMSLEETVSRKHFQQIADLLKAIEDPAKRKEMAMHHAAIFKQQNPRFDIARFGQAAGVDLAECAMYEELRGGQKKLDVDGDGDIGGDDLADLRAGAEVDEGYGEMDAFLKDREKQKGTGKFDKRQVSTGTVYTRKFDDEAEDDTDAPASKGGAPRGRGRPAVAKAPERVTAKSYKYKAGRKEVEEHGSGVENMKGKSWQASKAGAHAWNAESVEEGEQEVNEKAEAGKREFFDKLAPAAKKVARVVNKMTQSKQKDVKETEGKSAAVKKDTGAKADKGESNKIPEVGLTKVNAKGQEAKKKEKKVEETTTAGSVATASGGGSNANGVGKGIYDSFNRDVEKLIKESFTVNMSKTITDNGQNQSNINISATDSDADMLKDLLKNAGIDIHGGDQAGGCSTCGAAACGCSDSVEVDPVADGFAVGVVSGPEEMGHSGHIEFELDEADAPVTQNSPDYPTNQEYTNDSLQYAGGLNKPKSTGQTTAPVIASQLKRQMSEADSFLNLYQSFKAIK